MWFLLILSVLVVTLMIRYAQKAQVKADGGDIACTRDEREG
jgi:hypothetical protein